VAALRGGAPVAGLTPRDFVVLDNGVEQEVESVTGENDVPLEVQLVLDTSGSVSGSRLANLISAGTTLIGELRPSDKAALVTFSQTLHAQGRMTADLDVVKRALATLRGRGQTALRDAVELSLALPRDPAARALMVVFSDGVDNASWLTDEEVLDSARRADIVAHAVTVPSEPPSPATFLQQLTKATGGRIWKAGSDRELARLFQRALEEMRARYLLTFTPKSRGPAGWHTLKVSLRAGRADITARPGYFAAN
jgi:VWFA-related protein